jgi:hypothetical protein
MRHLEALAKAYDAARQNAQATVQPHLFALFKEKLQAEADPKQGHPVRYGTPDRRYQPGSSQVVHRIPESTHPWEHYPVRLSQVTGLGRDASGYAHVFKRLLHVPQVSHSIVKDRDVHWLQHPLCGGHSSVASGIHIHCLPQGTAQTLENGLDLVMGVRPAEQPGVQRHASVVREGAEELGYQLHVELAYTLRGKGQVTDEQTAIRKIEGNQGQGLVHRQ